MIEPEVRFVKNILEDRGVDDEDIEFVGIVAFKGGIVALTKDGDLYTNVKELIKNNERTNRKLS